jgi:hypothetical protein
MSLYAERAFSRCSLWRVLGFRLPLTSIASAAAGQKIPLIKSWSRWLLRL